MSSDEDVPAPRRHLHRPPCCGASREPRERQKEEFGFEVVDARATRIRFQISATNRHACKDWPHSHFRLPSCIYGSHTRRLFIYCRGAPTAAHPQLTLPPTWRTCPVNLPTHPHPTLRPSMP